MIISKKVGMLLPTVQFGNVPLEVAATVDTNNAKDLEVLGLNSNAKAGDVSSALLKFVETELFASKDAMEEHSSKDFNLQVDFSRENAHNDSMRPKSRY